MFSVPPIPVQSCWQIWTAARVQSPPLSFWAALSEWKGKAWQKLMFRCDFNNPAQPLMLFPGGAFDPSKSLQQPRGSHGQLKAAAETKPLRLFSITVLHSASQMLLPDLTTLSNIPPLFPYISGISQPLILSAVWWLEANYSSRVCGDQILCFGPRSPFREHESLQINVVYWFVFNEIQRRDNHKRMCEVVVIWFISLGMSDGSSFSMT